MMDKARALPRTPEAQQQQNVTKRILAVYSDIGTHQNLAANRFNRAGPVEGTTLKGLALRPVQIPKSYLDYEIIFRVSDFGRKRTHS
jgi:hypothetical protein